MPMTMKHNHSNGFKSKTKSIFYKVNNVSNFGILIVMVITVSIIPIIFYFFSSSSSNTTSSSPSNSLRTSTLGRLVVHSHNSAPTSAVDTNVHTYASNTIDDAFPILANWIPSFIQPKFIKDRVKSHQNCLNNRKDAILVPNINFLFYVIYHNKNSQKVAQKWCQCRPWCQPIEIPTTMFFESIFYRDFLPFLIDEWENKDFIGVGSYRSVVSYIMGDIPVLKQKLFMMANSNSSSASSNDVNSDVDVSFSYGDSHRRKFDSSRTNSNSSNKNDYNEQQILQRCDVAPLVYNNRSLLPQAIEGHTVAFTTAWEGVLTALGYELSYIHSFNHLRTFYRNSFLIRPHHMKKLIYFMNRAMEISLLDSTARSIMQKNASYQVGTDNVAERAFHTSYYQWHPFVFERLPVFYLNHIGLNICIPPVTD